MRILTWNVRSGGGKRCADIVSALQDYQADIIVLTEYRKGNHAAWDGFLKSAGYGYVVTSSPQLIENGILVASRQELKLVDGVLTRDRERWLCLHSPELGLYVLCVHIPGAPDHKFIKGYGVSGAARKVVFWKALNAFAEAMNGKRFLILGDFNTGLKVDAEGSPFKHSQYMQQLLDLGYVDVWRHCQGDRREYTYFSKQRIGGVTTDKNGFRLDYMFVSAETSKDIIGAFHSQEERKKGLSDHAILVADFSF